MRSWQGVALAGADPSSYKVLAICTKVPRSAPSQLAPFVVLGAGAAGS